MNWGSSAEDVGHVRSLTSCQLEDGLPLGSIRIFQTLLPEWTEYQLQEVHGNDIWRWYGQIYLSVSKLYILKEIMKVFSLLYDNSQDLMFMF